MIGSSIQVFCQDTLDTQSTPATGDTISSAQQTVEAQLDTGKRGFNIKTILELFKIAGAGFGFALAMTFVLGILFISQKWFVLIREKNDAQKIPVKKMKTMGFDDINNMFTKVKDDDLVIDNRYSYRMHGAWVRHKKFRLEGHISYYDLEDKLVWVVWDPAYHMKIGDRVIKSKGYSAGGYKSTDLVYLSAYEHEPWIDVLELKVKMNLRKGA